MPTYTFKSATFTPYSARGTLAYTSAPNTMMGVIGLVSLGVAAVNFLVLQRVVMGGVFLVLGIVQVYRGLPILHQRRFEVDGTNLVIDGTALSLVGLHPREEHNRVHVDHPTQSLCFDIDLGSADGRAFADLLLAMSKPGSLADVPEEMGSLRGEGS